MSRKRDRGEFTLVYKGSTMQAINAQLSGKVTAQAVLWQLLGMLRHHNDVLVTARELARASGFKEETVGKALRVLEGAAAIRRPKAGLIEINPYLVWCGGDVEREKQQAAWAQEMAWLAPARRAMGVSDADRGKVVKLEAVQ